MTCGETLAYWLDPWPWLWVEIPRRVSLQSKRLASVYLILVVAILSYLIADFVTTEAWHAKMIITNGAVTAWREAPASTVTTGVGQHCGQPELYDNQFSSGWTYRPRSCRLLTGSSAFRKQGNWLHFPTYLEETYTWIHSNCTNATKQMCFDMAPPEDVSEHVERTWEVLHETSCKCSLKDSFFAQTPEDEVLVIIHEYFLPHAGQYLPFFGLPEWGPVLTILRRPDGSRCEIGGKSSWTEEEAAVGIGASLRDWMRCAAADLDLDPVTMTGRASSNLASHLRTMGFSLQFDLEYMSVGAHSEDHEGVVCYVGLSVYVQWNSNVEVQRLSLPSLNSNVVEHQMYMYGVTPSFSFKGSFRYISHTPIMAWIVQAAVLFALPATIMRYIVEFAIGQPSTIYRRETCRPFDLYEHLRKTQARMLISHAAYKQISQEGPLDMERLYGFLEDLYQKQMKAGAIEADDLNLLWRATLTGFDSDMSGKVSLQEFVAAAELIDDLHIGDIVHFMDKDRKVSFMERFLDSTRHQMKVKNSTIMPITSVVAKDDGPDEGPAGEPGREAGPGESDSGEKSPRELS